MSDRVGVVQSELPPSNSYKRQPLADFIVEFTYSNTAEITRKTNSIESAKVVGVKETKSSVSTEGYAKQWTLYMDGTSNNIGSGAGIMLISPKRHKIHCVICFGFKVSNNEAEYETLIVGLRLTRKLQIRNVKILSDSQLVVNQANDIYLARGEKIATYLDKEKEELSLFSIASIEVIPRSKNANVDTLAKLASTRDVDMLDGVSMEFLAKPSIHPQQGVMELTQEPSWMDPIVTYLETAEQPEDKTEA